MLSVARYYMQNKSRILFFVGELPASKNVDTEAEEAMVLEAVTRRQSVKTQQTEKI
jgi:hypothetical protein